MPKNKDTYQITLERDQMDFIRWVKGKYGISDESKVIRIVMDYVTTDSALHPVIFDDVRCVRCD